MMSLVPMVTILAVVFCVQCVTEVYALPALQIPKENSAVWLMHQNGPLDSDSTVDLENLMKSMKLNDSSSCACSEKTCGCCQHIEIKESDIESQACVNVTFLSTQSDVKLALSVDGKVLSDKTVSIKHQDPVCMKLGENESGDKLCVELRNFTLSLVDTQFQASVCVDVGVNEFSAGLCVGLHVTVSSDDVEICIPLEVNVFGVTIVTVNLVCFRIPFKGLMGADHPLAMDWTNLMKSMHLNDASSCACSEKTCGCCQHIEIKEVGVDSQACVNVTFLSTQIGVKLALSVDGKVLFDKMVSIKHPDPVCVKLGENEFVAELCVELYNIAVSLADMQACARLEAKVFSKTAATVDLGCFKIPFKGRNTLKITHKPVRGF